MALNASLFSSESVEWGTPQDLFNEYHALYSFTLDVCASSTNAKLPNFFSREDSALNHSWTGNVCWMNPPYGSEEKVCKTKCKKKKCVKRGYHCTVWVPGAYHFVKKAAEECDKNGVTTVMLLPARTDTKWFHKFIYNQPRTKQIRFFKGRLRFVAEGKELKSAPFPSMLVVFSP